MRFVSSAGTRVLVDLRATGLLQAVGHDPTLSVRAEPFDVDVDAGEGEAIDAPVEVAFAVAAIEPPEDLSRADRDKMRDNLRGRDVLDAARFPSVDFRGRFTGTRRGGTLSGELRVRGTPRRITMAVEIDAADGGRLVARGAWEGRLTELGVKPFRALLGALRLEDWVRLRLDASLSPGR